MAENNTDVLSEDSKGQKSDRISLGYSQGGGRSVLLTRSSGLKSAFRLVWVAGRMQVHEVVEMKAPFLC